MNGERARVRRAGQQGCASSRGGRGRRVSYAGSPSRAAALASSCHLRRRLSPDPFIPASILHIITHARAFAVSISALISLDTEKKPPTPH
ncbi:jg15709 [Pararge aegeria aegeria]|uniref:Jg15709 protein n=1 Tax=Pararge aegeria aegeria TaxID=348720 RepID=A0A8S4QFL8_9NEOP|nr:jg15709 [Pararge aegeria aegeria]